MDPAASRSPRDRRCQPQETSAAATSGNIRADPACSSSLGSRDGQAKAAVSIAPLSGGAPHRV